MDEEAKPESHFVYAHRKSVELAMKVSDPILQPQWFQYHYWVSMGGFGFKQYYPGAH